MSALKDKLIRLIATQGPLNISQFMTLALADPEHGYYKTAEPFGKAGDFITAPEVSQMFGEMVAIWVVHAWQAAGSPTPFALCEMGPGRGTLMDDVLRTVKKLAPACFTAAHIYLVETSDKLKARQKDKLKAYLAPPRHNMIHWIEQFSDLPPMPLVLFSNELFDCLPIHQYIHIKGQWLERMVALDTAGNDVARLILSTGYGTPDPALLPSAAHNCKDGTIVEISPARLALMQEIAEHIATLRGAALIIDYGALQSGHGDTLQAMSKHGYRDVLDNPGGDDLTSHVDFAALGETARICGCQTSAMTQGTFLLALGLTDRAGRLGYNKNAAFQQEIIAAVERLAGDNQMGELFKVLCVSDKKTTMAPFSDWYRTQKPVID